MKQKKIFMIMILVLGVLLIPGKNYAVLQANPNTHGAKKNSITNWMTYIRDMETANQAMGLDETIDKTTKKSTSGSNKIDVHMIKSTEFGGVAILSASGYGNPDWIQNSEIKTTTGNKSGVYFNQAWEYTAGGLSGSVFSGVDGKYYDAYTTSRDSAKVGDGLGASTGANPGCTNWHGNVPSGWFNTNFTSGRGKGSVFGYGWDGDVAVARGGYLGRAAVVCGNGF